MVCPSPSTPNRLRQPKLPARSCRSRRDWVDPFVGARILYYATENWSLALATDIGGFGANSDFSWNVLGTVGWDITDWFTLATGYRALGVDYDNDKSGRSSFSYDTITHGPLVGFLFKI